MRIAVVTGASSGIGREFARQIPKFYKQLDEIWIIARNEEKLQSLKMELEGVVTIRIYSADITSSRGLQMFLEDFEREQPDIRMLVNAAGFGKMGNISEISSEEQCGMIDLNCRALTQMTCICLPYLSKGSRILNVASASAFSPQPGFAVYAATKSYVYSFSRALGAELKEKGIVVTAVCPGPVQTAFFDVAGEVKESKKSLMAKPEDVVKQALTDSRQKKAVSIYGMAMKGSRLASIFLPDQLLMEIMLKLNN